MLGFDEIFDRQCSARIWTTHRLPSFVVVDPAKNRRECFIRSRRCKLRVLLRIYCSVQRAANPCLATAFHIEERHLVVRRKGMADLTAFGMKVAEIAASSNIAIRPDFPQFSLERSNSNFLRIAVATQFFVATDIVHVGKGFGDDSGPIQ
jgi:hypothetical protein